MENEVFNVLDFKILETLKKVLSQINKELAKKRGDKYYFSIEQILIHHSPSDVYQILLKYSPTFVFLATSPNYKDIVYLLDEYMNKIYCYYDKILFSEQKYFDKYVSFARGDAPGLFSFNPSDLQMNLDQISNTIALLNESIRLWYDVYRNRTIVAEFNSGRYLYYKIKEGELAHLFGLIWRSLKNNEQLKKMGIVIPDHELEPEEKYEILLKIAELYDNGNILEYEHDRLKDIVSQYNEEIRTFKVAEIDHKFDFYRSNEALLPYPKINVRCKAFIDFKPLERLGFLLDLKRGIKVIANDSPTVKNSILFSKNDFSDDNIWSGFLSTKDNIMGNDYMRSILIKKTDENKKIIEELGEDCQKNMETAEDYITSKISIVDDDSSGGEWHVFSDEEKTEFLTEVLLQFYGKNRGDNTR